MSTADRKKDEVDTLQGEIRQLEDMILQLQERRVTLLQRLNSVQASTASIPPETLALIFEYASPEDYSYICPSTPSHAFLHRQRAYPAIAFSHVSWYWRQIAWSIPKLWNRMGVEVSKKNADSVCHMLELHLRNSKTLPFNLSVTFSFYSKDALQSTFGSVLSNSEYSRKIRILQLTDPQPEWLSTISTTCPQLECLSANRSILPWRCRKLSLKSASFLRHVCLRQISTKIVLPWSSITHITLLLVPIDICSGILLTQCPNLVYFRSAYPRNPTSQFVTPTPITALHLQTLFWACIDTPWCLTTFQNILVPALRTLSWADRDPRGGTESCVHTLFTHLPDTLLNLELVHFRRWSLPSFKYAFGLCRYVQVLTMGSCDEGSLYMAFCALCPGWEGDGTEYLPCLKSLVVDGCRSTDDDAVRVLGTDFSLRTLDICRAKRAGPHPWFTLELKSLKMNWAPSVREALCEMVQDGLQLDILEGNVRVGWFPQKNPRNWI